MKKKILLLILIFIAIGGKSQVLITDSNIPNPVIHPSAMLEVRSNNKGLLLPEVPLKNNTDNVTVPTPVNGVNVHSSTQKRFMFWFNGRWYRNFNLEDTNNIAKISTNYIAQQSNSTTIGRNGFATTMPLFTLDSNTDGWTDLGVSTDVSITKTNNAISINVEGMAATNNTARVPFQFAIGLFIDGKLKIVRKFFEPGSASNCMWKQFNLSGIIENVPITEGQEIHTVKVMARNLTRLNRRYSQITYGDKSGTNCQNLNPDMAKIVLSANVAQ